MQVFPGCITSRKIPNTLKNRPDDLRLPVGHRCFRRTVRGDVAWRRGRRDRPEGKGAIVPRSRLPSSEVMGRQPPPGQAQLRAAPHRHRTGCTDRSGRTTPPLSRWSRPEPRRFNIIGSRTARPGPETAPPDPAQDLHRDRRQRGCPDRPRLWHGALHLPVAQGRPTHRRRRFPPRFSRRVGHRLFRRAFGHQDRSLRRPGLDQYDVTLRGRFKI